VNKVLEMKGLQGKRIIADGNKIKMIRENAFEVKGERSILIKDITAVEVRKPSFWVRGYITFSIAGGSTAFRQGSLGGANAAAFDPNSVVFKDNEQYEIALAIKKYVDEYKEKHSSNEDIEKTVSVADELIKLKQLLDSGVLTEEEFSNQKAKLLS
jgi:hypothetical protein